MVVCLCVFSLPLNTGKYSHIFCVLLVLVGIGGPLLMEQCLNLAVYEERIRPGHWLRSVL